VQLNVYEAKTQLSSLLDRAVAGETIVIARAGEPLVRLVPVRQQASLISSELKSEHGDPFDRLLYAQAKHGKLRLLTVDEKIPLFGSAILRA
jgi:prevent-host-death family protein